MTQEDKAKAYDELINDIKRIIFNHEGGKLYNLLEQKDEQELPNSAYTSNKSINKFADDYSHMIWDKLMDKFNKIENYSIGCNDVSDIVLNAIINTYNWLKKKDEQKPQGKSLIKVINEEKVDNSNKVNTDKIKPKFKVGDWIINKTNNSVYQVIGYEDDIYRIKNPDCVYYQLLSAIDETYRLWTIKDAKPGDVVVTKYGNIFIFKKIKGYSVYDYCGLYFGELNVNSSLVDNSPLDYTPATKEQRDLLIKTLNNEGYTFDFDKKKVKSIIKNKFVFKVGDWIIRNNTKDVFLIKSTVQGYVTLEDTKGTIYTPCLAPSENEYHVWTIKDANDGDILTSRTPFIYGEQCPYGGLDWYNKKFIVASNFIFKDAPVHPATKKERKQLEKAMIDAGYEFDFEKKELNKLDEVKPKFHKGDYITSERGSFSIIANVCDVRYEVENLDHKKVFPDIGYIDKRYHLYTIEDSKFGDVLSTKDNIFIFGHDNKAIVGIPKTCWNIKGYAELKFEFEFPIDDVHPATNAECNKLKEVMTNYLSKYGK